MAVHGISFPPTPPAYASGRYYTPDGLILTAAGTTLAVGSIYLTPGYIRRPVTISSLITRITTLGAGNVQISLYASDPVSGDPTGAPLFTSASQSTGATGIVEVATSQKLLPGLYYLAIQADNTVVVFQSISASTLGFETVSGLATSGSMIGTANIIGFTKTGTFGTWPTLTGSRATDALAETTSPRCPAWGFKVA